MNEKYELGFSPLKPTQPITHVNKSKLDFSLTPIYFSLKFNFLPPQISKFITSYKRINFVPTLITYEFSKENKINQIRTKKAFALYL